MSDDEHESTALEIEQDEDNIEKIHERRTLLSEGRKKVKSPSCKMMLGKALVISIAGVLFILMMIELWADYGRVIDTKTLFSPKIYSISETCPSESDDIPQLTKEYNSLTCDMKFNETGTILECNGKMPPHPLVLPSSESGHDSIHIEGDNLHVTWLGRNISRCVRLLVWSI